MNRVTFQQLVCCPGLIPAAFVQIILSKLLHVNIRGFQMSALLAQA